ncbi:T-complex protein 11 [Xylariaceae sp. FL0255]|nr:T-complex protein 11 [Xylariaceae sp. FL0255]
MADQGSGIESRGIDNNSARRMSEAITNSHEDKIQNPTKQTEGSSAESKEQVIRKDPRTLSNSALKRGSSHRSAHKAKVEPPVTRQTLSELDVTKIIHNPKLRHDINFDPELHFRPNLDGEKGKRKQIKAEQFWETLREQLEQFITDRDGFVRQFGNDDNWSLPLLLRSVKDIIHTLVPTRDRMCLDEGLNVDLIMQQFSKGMADLEKLASWLSGVLKSHCAPMRDEWVDKMYDQLTNGNRTNDMKELVEGLRNLLSVLEAMKLDVANHQIRCLRPILIEDTVHFEQRFFLKKTREQRFDPAPAQAWYSQLNRVPEAASVRAFGDMAVFFEELVSMIMPSYAQKAPVIPNTFYFDEERITKLRSDVLDAINLEVCMRLYEVWQNLEKNMAIPDIVPSPYLATPLSDASGFLSSRSDDEGSEFSFNAPTSRPSSIVFSNAGSAHSSPRSSVNLSTPASTRSAEEQRVKSQGLYDSLIALLQSSNSNSRGASRWKAMQDSLALQIFRFTNAPTRMLQSFEDSLDRNLGDVPSPTHRVDFSPLFLDVEQAFRQKLLAELQLRVKEFKGLTGVGLFSMATGGRLQGPNRTMDGSRDNIRDGDRDRSTHEAREDSGVDDMATRVAHLGLLHWRVWAQLVYLGDMDCEMIDSDESMGL